jgi:hypothetical protein
VLKRRAAQQELRPPDASRKAAATATGVTWQHFARCAPAPLRSRLVVDRVRRGGQCGNQGAFTTTQNTTYSPRPRRRKGVGGEGERHPKKHQSSRPLPLLVFNQPNPPTPRFIRSIPYPIRSPKTTNAKPLLSAFPFAASRLRVRPTRPRIPIPPNNTQGATTLPHSSGDSPKDFHPCQSVFIRGRNPSPRPPSRWDGETVIRTLADRTRTYHFAGSQASADSSFSPHAKAQRRQDEVLGK